MVSASFIPAVAKKQFDKLAFSLSSTARDSSSRFSRPSVLTRPRPCGIPARKTEMAHENQEDAPVWAQGQATSQTDLSSFNGQPNTKAFCLFE